MYYFQPWIMKYALFSKKLHTMTKGDFQ